MKRTGIWLDKNNALIVTLENNNETLDIIESNVEHYNIRGGSGTRLKGGPQDVVQDSKFLEREKHQMNAYFDELAKKIKDTDAIVLFGPSDTNEKFYKKLKKDNKKLAEKVEGVEKADSMTNNQVRAWVRDFFK